MDKDDFKYLGMNREELIDVMCDGVRRYLKEYSTAEHPEDITAAMTIASDAVGCVLSELVDKERKSR